MIKSQPMLNCLYGKSLVNAKITWDSYCYVQKRIPSPSCSLHATESGPYNTESQHFLRLVPIPISVPNDCLCATVDLFVTHRKSWAGVEEPFSRRFPRFRWCIRKHLRVEGRLMWKCCLFHCCCVGFGVTFQPAVKKNKQINEKNKKTNK